MASPLPESDGDLVLLALEGRQDAFSALYERYFPSVYDFLTRLLRSRDEAADVAQDTFIKALEQLHSLKAPEQFKSWLFAIAHRTGLNRVRTSKRTTAVGRVDDDERASLAVADPDPSANPEEMASIQEAADIVWEAAAGLDPRTYAVMDLHVRQGLDSAEIAEVMGVTKGNAYTMVSRMKQSFSNTLATYLLVRKGRQDCDDLAGIVEPDVSKMTPELRRRADRHVAKCSVCSENRALFVEPVKMFAALMLVPVPAGLKAAIWGSVAAAGAGAAGGAAAAAAASGAAGASAGASAGGGAAGAGVGAAAGSQIGLIAAAAAAAVVVAAIAVGGFLFFTRGPEASEVVAASEEVAAPPAADAPIEEVADPTLPPVSEPPSAEEATVSGDDTTTATTVPPSTDAPAPGELVVSDDSAVLDEDTSVTIDVIANDGAVDGASVAVVTGPAHGTTRVTSTGSITYTPAPDFAGSDRLTYSVADAGGRNATGVVRITIRPVNDAPSVPSPGTLALAEDTTVTFDPTEGATDVDGDTLSVAVYDLSSAAGGRISSDATTYTPPADFSGSDSFSYRVTDGTASVTVTVSVEVSAVPDRPDAPAGGVSGTGVEDTTTTIDLLDGWTDADGDSLRLVATTVTTTQGGTAGLVAGGTATYTPAADFAGTDSFTYTVTDGVFSVTATATITVAGVNDPPTVQGATFTVDAGAAPNTVIGQIVASDRDAGDTLVFTISAGNTGGQLKITAGGQLQVAEITDASAFPLSLTVRVTDGGGLSDTATVAVNLVDSTGPSISSFGASPSRINAFLSPGVACPVGASRSNLSAVVRDPNGVASVVFNYSGTVAGLPLSGSIPATITGSNASGSFAITITGITFTEATFDFTVVATDGLGHTSSAGGVTVTVLPCPG